MHLPNTTTSFLLLSKKRILILLKIYLFLIVTISEGFTSAILRGWDSGSVIF